MSLRYLPEYAENARLTLALAKKELAHLDYSHRTLFLQVIDLKWVLSLTEREDLAEKVDAFVARFSRLQDHLGEKLLPSFARLLGESPKSLLDVLAYAEKNQWLEDAESFVNARKLRNLLVHEYMDSPQLFLEALHLADGATKMLKKIVENMEQQAQSLELM